MPGLLHPSIHARVFFGIVPNRQSGTGQVKRELFDHDIQMTSTVQVAACIESRWKQTKRPLPHLS